jgi:Glycosyl hydrolase family 12
MVVIALGIGIGDIGSSSGALAAPSLPPESAGVTLTPETLSFFPRAEQSGPWEWDAECPFLPAAKSGCQDTDPVYGSIILNGDLWNIDGTASGDAEMDVDPEGRLVTSADFSSAQAEHKTTWVRGYPNVTYGVSPQAPADAPPRSPELPLPLNLKQLPHDVIATADYDVSETSSVTFDLAYDIWLEPHKEVRSPRAKTLELMIWTDENGGALPPGYKEEITMPYSLDGAGKAGSWSVYMTNASRASNATTTVELVLKTPQSNAQIGVDLNNAFSSMEKALTKEYPSRWNSFSSYYLDAISLGTEFGPLKNRSDAGPLAWNLDSYNLNIGGQLPAPS